ncbi:hypothetical protein PTTG_04180 [Puccinia triticina 1-1 BBBD Race 1]|uniref:Uncharacterized protein n=2 Tax=Puccinia triticina TaxID=208348 RepID=A0A0C4ETQ1_PUCT1|nr:uncharacterized protein PtA15_7A554 [Puccinia triticina]OAV95662.1 hypothetical protein PTTG_04180 [Puccinia triticina 1-1 BBBD Race 1]WAQ86825.1 hypothetical protein PtA15_7A554 [Puccinia triticina]WAR56693.1 hypothetical protein PtB15_7B543 [Puccinia triticina]
MSRLSPVDARSLMPALADAEFAKLVRAPTGVLIPFLNSILGQKGVAITSIDGSTHHEVIRAGPAPDEDRLGAPFLRCYRMVANTDQDQVVDVQIQLAYRAFDLHGQVPYSTARLAGSHNPFPRFTEDPFEKHNPIPSEQHKAWLLWGPPSGARRKKAAWPPVKEPTVRFCYISLPTFRDVVGDEVSSCLERLLWILANTGPRAASRSLPDWIQDDPAAKLWVDLLRKTESAS